MLLLLKWEWSLYVVLNIICEFGGGFVVVVVVLLYKKGGAMGSRLGMKSSSSWLNLPNAGIVTMQHTQLCVFTVCVILH